MLSFSLLPAAPTLSVRWANSTGFLGNIIWSPFQALCLFENFSLIQFDFALLQSLFLFRLSAPSKSIAKTTALFSEDESSAPVVERGVSVDQDGKSNVWAIEPKMEVESTSAEEKVKGYLFAGAGLVAFAGAAGVALSNLPDPNQF